MSDLIGRAKMFRPDGCEMYCTGNARCPQCMADFATAAIKTERERIATELERITNGSSCEVNSLIAELRGGK